MTRHKPFARGVSQLMYVGDDGTATPVTRLFVLLGCGLGLITLFMIVGFVYL